MIEDLACLILVQNDQYWLPYSLKSVEGHFENYVIYDVGSTDYTGDVISDWVKANPYLNVIHERFPQTDRRVQIAYRNAMIAEARTEYYYLLDGDEVLSLDSINAIKAEYNNFVEAQKPYGVINRVEVWSNLITAYSQDSYVPHHRLYHRFATWQGRHPGEVARTKQTKNNTYKFSKDATVYHFHNTLRSPEEEKALCRMERKGQHTYHPGNLSPINLFEKLPILKENISKYDINPVLRQLQEGIK